MRIESRDVTLLFFVLAGCGSKVKGGRRPFILTLDGATRCKLSP